MSRVEEPGSQVEVLASPPKRHLTVLYTDLSNSTALSGTMEAEINAELNADVERIFESAVAARQGTYNQLQGDGFQAFFGEPHAIEDDGQRAVEVALEVRDRVQALRAKYAVHGAGDLSVHSGVHAGLVLTQPGDDAAGRYRLYGPAPGIAKHLSDEAAADEILVSAETLGPRSALFHTEELPLSVKGRVQPFAVYRVLARNSLKTRFEAHVQRGLVPFIGRHAELKWLMDALDSVRSGRPRFVAVQAPAGVGKTRLAEEFLHRAAATIDCTVSRGYCERDLSAEPLQPFLQMLRSQFGLSALTSPAAASAAFEERLSRIAPALSKHRLALLQALSLPPQAQDGAATPRQTPEQTIKAVRELVVAAAQVRPQIIFIDDWQWADQATRQVVYAICELRELPILVLAATRPMEVGDAQLTSADMLELSVFSDAEADTTIGRLLPRANPFVADAIRRHSGGNALFLEELCHSAASTLEAQGRLDVAPAGSVWLETLIASRVTRLPPEHNEVLCAAAVIGNVVPTWLLERLTGCGEDHATVHALAAQDFIFPGDRTGTLRFKHGITREVVYATLGLHRRHTMHRRIALLMHDRTQSGADIEAVEALAYHHAGAADLAEAARYAEMAGDKAMAASSIDRAKAHYRNALAMLERQPDTPQRYQAWRSIVRRLGLASVFDPSREDLEIFHRAVALAHHHHDAPGGAYAEYWLAYVNYALGEARAAVKHCELAMSIAKDLSDPRLVEQIHVTRGQALAAAADYRVGLQLLEEATVPEATRRGSGRPGASVAFSLTCKASILGDLGRFDDAHACFEEALRFLPWPGHEVEGSVMCWRSGVKLWQGRWEDARQDALRAQRVGERVKSLYLFAMGRALGAYSEWQLARAPDALRSLAEAVSWLEARDKSLFISLAHGWLAEAAAAEGRPDDARVHATRALQRARKRDWLGAAMAFRALAAMAAAQDDEATAQRYLEKATKVARGRHSPHEAACNDWCTARLAQARGDRPLALAHIERAIETFGALRMQWHLAEATRLHAGLR